MISEGRIYWLVGNPNAFLLKLVELLVLFPHLEFADQVMLPIALAMLSLVVVVTVLPLNLVAFVELEDVAFIVSWMFVVPLKHKTCAKAFTPIVRGAGGEEFGTVALPGK